MNPRRDKESKLLAETFCADWDSAQGFAQAAAAAARRRNRLRRLLAASGAAAVLALGLAAFFRSPPATPAQATSITASRGYEIMSDDEFFAVVRDQPILVVTAESGARNFIFLHHESPVDSVQ